MLGHPSLHLVADLATGLAQHGAETFIGQVDGGYTFPGGAERLCQMSRRAAFDPGSKAGLRRNIRHQILDLGLTLLGHFEAG